MSVAWVGLAVTAVGTAVNASNAEDAEDAQYASSQAALANERDAAAQARADRMLAREDQKPYREAGYRALKQLEDANTLDGAALIREVQDDPGYQFGLQQGQLALDRKAAAGGGRVSGASLKAASEYATNYATTGYNAAYQRRQDRLNRLAALAGIGQTATNNSGIAGASNSNAISNLITAQGNASAAGQLAQGNIWGNGVNQLVAAGQQWAKAPDRSWNQNVPMYQQGFTTTSD